MSKQSLFQQLRVLVLVVAVGILATDTFSYYFEKAEAHQAPPAEDTILSPALLTPETPKPPTIQDEDTKVKNFRVTSFTEIEKINTARIQAAQSSFLKSTHSTSVTDITVYELKYDIRSKNGSWQPIIAKVYIPNMTGKYPLFVFGSGTTGIADKCAPSLENMAVENLGNYHNHMITQAAEGYVAVFPDYEGYNNPDKTEAYFISESEAKTLLGSIQSLLELESATPPIQSIDLSTVFLSGYSQGGHAALSAARKWSELPDTVRLAGIVEFAGAADVQALFVDSPWLASYLVQSYIDYYGSNVQAFSVLQTKWLQEMSTNNENLCVNEAFKYYPKSLQSIYSPSFIDAIESDTWPDTLENWHAKINENTPLSNIPNVPHVSIQGATDPIVTAKTQSNNVETLCKQGHSVTYKEYPGVNHFDIRKAGFEFSNIWMKDVLVGNPVPVNCP